jgi:transposase
MAPRRLGPSSSATTSTTERALPSSAVQVPCWSGPTTTSRLPRLESVGKLDVRLEVVKRSDDLPPGFHVLPRRWAVERTFGWLTRCRRLCRDYERRTAHAQGLIKIAMISADGRPPRRTPTPLPQHPPGNGLTPNRFRSVPRHALGWELRRWGESVPYVDGRRGVAFADPVEADRRASTQGDLHATTPSWPIRWPGYCRPMQALPRPPACKASSGGNMTC